MNDVTPESGSALLAHQLYLQYARAGSYNRRPDDSAQNENVLMRKEYPDEHCGGEALSV